MKVNTYQCDGCGKQKEKANHWYRGYEVNSADNANAKQGVLIIQWDAKNTMSVAEKYDKIDDAAHLCGAACVTEWLSKNLLN